ncbi:MAG: hypothetical protein IT447_05925 [Phycisphaerales bacterium]|jgi:hypothetical protein|nr:hypothetical protein [Phycisphaerales bacterium]
MAALAPPNHTLFLRAATALGRVSFAPTWSDERATVVTQEAMARLHSSNLPSVQTVYDDEVVEYLVIPLVPMQTVRVRFRDIGQLPPMNLEDEVGEFIDD